MDKKKLILITVVVCLGFGLAVYDSKANDGYVLKSFAQLYDSSNKAYFNSKIPNQRSMLFSPDIQPKK